MFCRIAKFNLTRFLIFNYEIKVSVRLASFNSKTNENDFCNNVIKDITFSKRISCLRFTSIVGFEIVLFKLNNAQQL